ncbi:DUF4192 family protein [Enteractinococcus fodinae]|uniref:DUF4192 family protein n=1 Tax=Enteractinococcus fodinae TaxID=684663 RepID=A0ABU2B104_9MICC|nr:DUF4192 family protein [Enteractinococcus fodinae]MDR7347285.1 hypothetical protein [Enteractinococcus fodinae]
MDHYKNHPDYPESQSDLFSKPTPLFAVPSEAPGANRQEPNPQASQPLQVDTSADVLAYIACTLGFQPRNSIAVVAFADTQMSTVVRCDLPESLQHMARCDTPESVTYMDFGMTEDQELEFISIGRQLGEVMAREPSTTSCLVIYIADDVTVSDQQALAVMGTANSVISAQFALQGIPVQESWLIHHEMLWHLRCPETIECVVQGEPIGDPQATEIYQALAPREDSDAKPDNTPRPLVFPPTATELTQEEPDTQELLLHRPQVVLNWLQLWDQRLSAGPAMLHSDQVAQLLSAVEHRAIRDALVAIACFDLPTAIKGMVGLHTFPAQLAAIAEVHGNLSDGTTVQEGLKGRSQRAPNWQRIAELERLCRLLLPLSDGRSAGALAGMLVWIEWVRGRGSVALTYVRQARKHFPADQLLVILERLLELGTVAEWAIRVDCAWSPQHAA